MSDNSKIEWTEATWNPITGCSVTSAGCKNCYAMKLAGTRLQHHPSRAGLTHDTSNGPVWTGDVRFNAEWLDQPLHWKRPRRIFVCAHADLFHDAVPDSWIDRVFAVMALAPWHTFQVLTKRPERMFRYLSGFRAEAIGFSEAEIYEAFGALPPGSYKGPTHRTMPLPNVWLGVSVENQEAAEERIPMLLQTPAAVRWVSAEPLLGHVNLVQVLWQAPGEHIIDWLVVGGESGPHARPMHPDWARGLRDQCAAAGVPFLFKQWGEWVPDPTEYLEPLTPHNGLHCWGGHGAESYSVKVGKKRAGRLLDGVLHDGYPGGAA